MALTRDQILEASDLQTETVAVPEWGGDVIVRTMTAADRDQFELSMVIVEADGRRRPDMTNVSAKLIAATVIDEGGSRLFTEADVQLLAGKSAAALARVYAVAARLNGLGGAAVEDAAKN